MATISKKSVFEAVNSYVKNEGDYELFLTLVVEGSLAYTILSERRLGGRTLSEKQSWVVAFSVIEAGNADKAIEFGKASFKEKRMEHEIEWRQRNWGKSF